MYRFAVTVDNENEMNLFVNTSSLIDHVHHYRPTTTIFISPQIDGHEAWNFSYPLLDLPTVARR